MERRALSILVENHAGVLSRITGLFSRRCYNIDSLSVGETENPAISRITIVTNGDELVIEQIKNQVGKLIDVIKIMELKPANSVYRELALVKIAATPENRPEVVGMVDIFRASIIDVSPSTLTVELTGDQSKVNAFLALVEPYGIKEIVRTGLTGLERGASNIQEYNEFKEEN